jgi:hypothetical protein
VTVRTYPNQKPWITGNIRTELKARAATFKERDSNPEACKKSRYALRRTIKRQIVNTGLKSNRTTPALLFIYYYFFISTLFSQVGQLRTSFQLQLRPGHDKAK